MHRMHINIIAHMSSPVRVAMIVNDAGDSSFKNGSVQQPFMMCLAFEKANIEFDLFSKTPGIYYNYKTRALSELFTDTQTSYRACLMVCHIKTFGDSPELDAISRRTKLVHVLCGHHAIFTIEDMVFKQNRCADMLVNKYAGETWIFNMHTEFSDLYKHWLDTPVKRYPYVWDSTVIDTHARENKLSFPRVLSTPCLPLTIVIAEANLNVTKTCFLPLIAASAYARAHPDRVLRVIVLCQPGGEGWDAFLRYLEPIADRLELHDRLVWAGVAAQLLARAGTVPVLLCHHTLNELNFLQLEAFHIGVPVVHNSQAFIPAGFYYDDWNVSGAIEQLDCVYKGARNLEVSKAVTLRYSPDAPEVVEGFKKLLEK
jgi:Protein of unknown function (DUF2827)